MHVHATCNVNSELHNISGDRSLYYSNVIRAGEIDNTVAQLVSAVIHSLCK